jgi:2-methylcitrate dehydratase PrpD
MSAAHDEPSAEDAAATRHVAEFIVGARLDDLPDRAVERAKRLVLDGAGLAVAGSVSQATRIVAGHAADLGAVGDATALGSGHRLPARFAALVNGVAIHVDDYDDTQVAAREDRATGMLTHPTAPVLPAVLALAEAGGRSGAEALLAYAVGVEVESRLAEAIDPRHYLAGHHSSATLGAFGAGAAASVLHRFDGLRAAWCVGIAGSRGAGLRQHAGTMSKALQVGCAAEAGVVAADLVARGHDGDLRLLEGDRGFFSAAGGGWDPAEILDRLGSPWTLDEPGVAIKPHPSGVLSHPTMSAFATLLDELALTADDIVRVEAGVNRYTANALAIHRPTTGHEGRFSLELCLASLAVTGRAGLAEFTDEVVASPGIQAFIPKVTVGIDDWADQQPARVIATRLIVHLADGRVIERRATDAKGSPTWPLTDDEQRVKVLECTRWGGVADDAAEEAAALILDLEHQPDLTRIIQLLTRGGPA